MGFGQEELQAVNRVMEAQCLSLYQGNWSENFYGGPEVQALEKEWAEYFGVKHAIACNSATSGLWMALNAIGLKGRRTEFSNKKGNWSPIYHEKFSGSSIGYPPDEVIVSPYTMTCSASLPLLFGAKPVFADIEPDYFCIDPEDIERKITRNTKAIIAVDIFGQPCDFDRINEIAERKGKEYGDKIYVIEDTAQAPGAKYKSRYAGTLGDIGVFSLNRHKHVHCGEGGVCVTNDDELAFKLRLSMNHAEAVVNDITIKEPKHFDLIAGFDLWSNLVPMVGMNLRMVEISAAIAREQLKKLDDILKVYREDAKYFPVKVRENCEHSYYRYAFIPNYELSIEGLKHAEAMLTGEFNWKTGYIKPIHQMPLFKHLGYDQNQCPVCESVNESIVLAWHKVAP